jgi:hypothetical protein
MPAIVIGTEDKPKICADATDPSRKRSITRPSLSSLQVDAPKVPVRPQHKPTRQGRRSHGATRTKPGEVAQ